MRILITGGAGFIGSSVALALRARYPEYELVVFDNLKRRGSELNLEKFRQHGIHFIHGDIRNSEDLEATSAFDLLIEASAEPSVLAGLNTDPTYVINNNLYGSINCFNACLKQKAKLIFLSTSRVYPIDKIEGANFIENDTRFDFDSVQNEPGISEKGISEKLDLTGARSFYGTTKLSSELFIREYAAFYGLDAAVTRFGVVAGPGQWGKTDQGVVTLWMARHYWKKELSYIGYGGTGKQVRDILHVDDLVDLVDLQIQNMDSFAGHVFNAGGGQASSASLMEMTRMCEEITGNKIQIAFEPENRPADLRAYISDNTQITQNTGWQPERSAQNVFEDVFNWIHENERMLKPLFS